MITVGIIDPDPDSRTHIKTILLKQSLFYSKPFPTIEILFSDEALDMPSVLSSQEKPAVILLSMHGIDPEPVRIVKTYFPESELIVLGDSKDVRAVREYFKSGAVSYLIKESLVEDHLLFAIDTTHQGGTFVSPSMGRALIQEKAGIALKNDQLTGRELQVANGLIDGLSYKLIADRYDISIDTVRVYIKRIYRKLNINSKGELFAQLIT